MNKPEQLISDPKLRHTPGPWHVTACLDYWVEHGHAITGADDGFMGVALCGDISWPNSDERQKEWEANARLIAAAPDLLEALKVLADQRWTDRPFHGPGSQDEWLKKAAAAIANATGAA
jgi:hypothetical protein